jgi:nitroreductase
MDFSELIRTRYSVRAYKPDPVEQEKLDQVLEAARLAPTAANRQPFQRMDGKPYTDVDVTIAMDYLILAATELGLGTCWVAAFDPEAAREELNLPYGIEPIAFTPLGYPADQPRPKQRKPLPALVRYL